ncbi:RimK/LysX family protein [Patescibacteria group bacterium]|nr:RimK/LysX family protein [Patescibacteria group bacterium]
MFEFFKKSRSVLGMNARNLDFIRPYNSKRAKEIANNKLLCKSVLKKNGVSVSDLIAKIKTVPELESFDWQSLPASFALKPNRGFGGEGIIVVYGKKKDRNDAWIKADGSLITIEDLKNHVRNIIDGSFSLSNIPDIAFFEERLQLLKLFKPYAYKGIPDIRVIVFNKVPVMAMLRLPTQESEGKANLQQGAIGTGIDMSSGVTTTAIHGKSGFIDTVPETRMLLSGLKIPYWKDILTLSVKAQEVSKLGFLGVDIAIDKEKGPVILEINARPGLSIQLCNQTGLKERLERVRGLQIKTVEKGVRVGMELFGGEIEEELENISGKKIIGSSEKIKFLLPDEKEIEVLAKIDTGAYSTSIDIELARQLGFGPTLESFSQIDISSYKLLPENESLIKKDFLEKYKEKIPFLEDVAVIFSSSGSSLRPVVKTGFKLDNEALSITANITDRTNLKYPAIIGKRDLKKFLIDVTK